jgi:hypothetical protein
MEKHQLSQVEAHVRALISAYSTAGDTSDLDDLIRVIHNPGWTTPAELQFVTAALESLNAQAKQTAALRASVVTAARAVGTTRAAGA